MGKYPQVILSMYFYLGQNNERPDWMTDLKHTDSHAKKMHVKERHKTSHMILSIIFLEDKHAPD
jgi:hypothetical protein